MRLGSRAPGGQSYSRARRSGAETDRLSFLGGRLKPPSALATAAAPRPYSLASLAHPTPCAMEFFEFVLVISLTVGLPITILKMVMEYKKSQLEARRGLGDATGVTAGELKRMLAEVVREANAPLVERIEELEHRAEIVSPASDRYLDTDTEFGEDAEFDAEAEVERTLGRRLRG